MSTRQQAQLRETARLLRSPGCARIVARALQWSCLSVPQMTYMRSIGGRWRPSTIRGALRSLRMVGLAEPTDKKHRFRGGGPARLWRAV
jgi:hypothetical protein